MNDVTDLSRTVVAKSDQLNAEDLLAGPITVTVQAVRATETDQPISIHIDGGRQPYKPCKSMRRLLIFAWGKNGNDWVGRSMTLHNDQDVVWAGVKVGGIRISHLSHINTDFVLALSEKKGKRKPHHVKKLQVAEPKAEPAVDYPEQLFAEKLPAMRQAIADGKMTAVQVIERCEKTGKLSAEQRDQINEPIQAQQQEKEMF